MLRNQLLDTSRGRVVTLLREAPRTVDEIAAALALTPNAVRAQLTGMERDGVVRRVGQRRGVTRPSQVFELTPEMEQFLSQAYVPVLVQLVTTFAKGLEPDHLVALLRETGRDIASQVPLPQRPGGNLRERAEAASEWMNEHLGALMHVEENGGVTIKAAACPLAAVTGKHPGLCLAIESLVTEFVGGTVRECCDRTAKPRCCFHLQQDVQPPLS